MKSLFSAIFVFAIFGSISSIFGDTDTVKISIVENEWIQQHNDKISKGLRSEIKRFLTTGYHSANSEVYPTRKLLISGASDFGIPFNENKICKLEELQEADVEGSVFLIADYQSHEKDPQFDLYASNVYLKFGSLYKALFRESSCRFVKLGKNSPVFIEVENQCADGYGTTLYRLNKDALGKAPVFDEKEKSEILKAGYYTEEVLGFYIWQEGRFQYLKTDKDDNLEVVVKSTAEIPKELISIISKKLNWTENEVTGDLAGPWGNVVSVYKWNGKKFENLADYYDH